MTTPPTTNDDQSTDGATLPLLVDITQAAAILAISRSSIYQLIWTDQLTPIRIGRSVRFSVSQLERFVSDRTAQSTGAIY